MRPSLCDAPALPARPAIDTRPSRAAARAPDRAFTVAVAMLVLAAGVRLVTLGTYVLTDTTEARYAEVAREMVAGGDWITQRIDGGRPFWAKPPLSTWATAVSFHTFGVNEFAARLPSFLFAAASVYLLHRIAHRLHGAAIARASAVVLATGALSFVLAGGVMVDPSLGFATTLCLAGAVLALADAGTPAGRRAGYVFFAGLGLGLLAKGPVAVVLSAGPLVVWALWKRRVGDVVRAFPWFRGSLLALAIAVPWYWAAEVRTPGFLRYFLAGEHFGRFLDPAWAGDRYGAPHTQPRGAIWILGALAAFPWSFVVLPRIWRLVRRGREGWARVTSDPWAPLFLAWTAAPFVLFTPSGSVIVTYVLPAMAPFALLAARLLAQGGGDDRPVARRTFVAAGVAVPVLFASALPFAAPILRTERSQIEVVRAWEHEARGAGPLVYAVEAEHNLNDVRPSADFYSGGRIERVAGTATAQWADILRRPEPLFVVTKRRVGASVPAEVRPRLDRLAEAGERVLWRVRPD